MSYNWNKFKDAPNHTPKKKFTGYKAVTTQYFQQYKSKNKRNKIKSGTN